MKKLILGIALLSTALSYADSDDAYDFREQTEITCESLPGKSVYLKAVIQRETYIGQDRYFKKNEVRVGFKLEGMIDGVNVEIDNSESFEVGKDSRIANQVEFSFTGPNDGPTVSLDFLSTLTGDETMPGQSIKLIMPNGASDYLSGDAILNIVGGLANLYVDEERFKTVAVSCMKKRDTADSGEEYEETFENL